MSGYYVQRFDDEPACLPSAGGTLFEADSRAIMCALIASNNGPTDASSIAALAVEWAAELHNARCVYYEELARKVHP